jgi:uncharacterized ubiquitin-like protein YukD
MADAQPSTSCRSLSNPLKAELNPICHLLALLGAHHILHVSRISVKQLEILRVPCQCIHSLLNFIINNQEIFQTNLSMHNINTRNKHHLHSPNGNLSCLQKSTFYAGIKIFISLPPNVTILRNEEGKI